METARTIAMPRLARHRNRLPLRRAGVLVLALGMAPAVVGCQSLFTPALPNGIVLREDARTRKLAEADQFPSPADVGLDAATSVP
jgi:hypothetical protein